MSKFRSKFEKTVASLFKKARVKASYEPYKIPYVLKADYTPDFVVKTKDGDVIIETKGVLDASDRKKMVAVKECNPDLDIRFWFMKDNYLSNKTKASKYSDWAKKHSFPFHIGDKFPKHWFSKEK